MNIEKKLDAWTRKKLIQKSQAEAILKFEKSSIVKKSVFSYLFLVMAVLFCLWGVVSIVAYNWDAIPSWLKLAASLMLLAASAAFVFKESTRARYLVHEAAILAYAGMIVCNIALIAQVYQLDSDFANGVMLWLALALPALIVSKGPWLFWGWLGALIFVLWHKAFEVYDFSNRQFLLASAFVGLALFSAYLASAKIRLAKFAPVFKAYAFAVLSVVVFMVEFFFRGGPPASAVYIGLFALAVMAFAACFRKDLIKGKSMPVFVAAAYAMFVFAFMESNHKYTHWDIGYSDSGFVYTAILLSVALLCLYKERRPRLFNACFALLSLRLTIHLFAKFSSLLLRGFGFIAIGLMFFGLFKLWQNISANMLKGRKK